MDQLPKSFQSTSCYINYFALKITPLRDWTVHKLNSLCTIYLDWMHVWANYTTSLRFSFAHSSFYAVFKVGNDDCKLYKCTVLVYIVCANKIRVRNTDSRREHPARHQRNENLDIFAKKNYILWKHAYKSTLLNANCNPWFYALLKPTTMATMTTHDE